MEYATKGENIRCVEGVCKRPFHVWHVLLIVCCDCCLVAAARPHKYRAPESQMSNYGSEIFSIYRKPMLGTQRDVTADKTSLDNHGLPVDVYNRRKTKSKDQVFQKNIKGTTPLRVWGKIQSEKRCFGDGGHTPPPAKNRRVRGNWQVCFFPTQTKSLA